MNEDVVLDASALLCLLQAEPGAEQVAAVLGRAAISAVNVSEVYAKLSEIGGSEAQIARAVGALRLRVVAFDARQALAAGTLRSAMRALGLSFGDRACPALALLSDAVALTTDRAWKRLPADLGITVRTVR